MKQKPVTIEKLANEAGVDIDTVLLEAWELGHIDRRIRAVNSGGDRVPPKLADLIRGKLNVATPKQRATIEYWCKLLGRTSAELAEHLQREDISLSAGRRKLPPGAIKSLRRFARELNINPLTGMAGNSSRPPAYVAGCESSLGEAPPPPIFQDLGIERELRWLKPEEINSIHDALVDDYAGTRDPIEPPGRRDDHLLESAVFRPQTSLSGTLKYPTVETSAAALLCALIHDHPFHNGNKRTALVSTLVFLDENGMVLRCDNEELFQFVMLVAKHRLHNKPGRYSSDHEAYAAAQQITKWSCVVRKSERSITFRKLHRRLREYNCTVDVQGNGKARICRTKRKRARNYFFPSEPLVSVVPYKSEGAEVPPYIVKKIRKDLGLTHEEGYDEDNFYSKKPFRIDPFIAKYRKTLNRLSKL